MNEPQNSMIRLWIGTALLAGSWLLGLGYFYPANPWAWLATVLAAIVLLSDTDSVAISLGERRSWRLDAASLALLLPAVWFAPWPDRAAPLLLVLGLTLQLLPIRQRWSDRLTCGAMAAGVVMLVQALALEVYSSHTAWSHELPWPLPDLLGGIAGLLGIDAAVDGSSVVMHSMRQVHRLRATWELLLDPTTFLFLVGGLTALGLRRNGECGTSNEECVETAGESADSRHLSSFVLRHSDRWSARLRSARWFTLIVLAWLPCRAGLLMALYLHRVLRSDPNRPLHAMNHFFSPWLLLLLLSVPVLLAWRFVRAGNGKRAAENADQTADEQATEAPPPPHSSFLIPHSTFRPLFLASLLVALAIALFTAAIYWDPVALAGRDG